MGARCINEGERREGEEESSKLKVLPEERGFYIPVTYTNTYNLDLSSPHYYYSLLRLILSLRPELSLPFFCSQTLRLRVFSLSSTCLLASVLVCSSHILYTHRQNAHRCTRHGTQHAQRESERKFKSVISSSVMFVSFAESVCCMANRGAFCLGFLPAVFRRVTDTLESIKRRCRRRMGDREGDREGGVVGTAEGGRGR